MDLDLRAQLYAIFGHDVDQLANQLDLAGRHHRELAPHLRSRQPDGLITATGATQLANLHDSEARRCDRMAATVRRALDNDAAPAHEQDPSSGDRH